MTEKKWLVKTKRKCPLINADSEIYGPCRHMSKFNRLLSTLNCTDKNGDYEKGKCPIAIRNQKQTKKLAKKMK